MKPIYTINIKQNPWFKKYSERGCGWPLQKIMGNAWASFLCQRSITKYHWDKLSGKTF